MQDERREVTWIPCSRQYSYEVFSGVFTQLMSSGRNSYLPAGVGNLAAGLADCTHHGSAKIQGRGHGGNRVRFFVDFAHALTVETDDLSHGDRSTRRSREKRK